ncbi:MAG: response regulator [Nitrospiraceae bacterium]|nr:response regulator [Nitrospiraceae bacterium]
MRILIAEDDETSRIVLETLLKKWGHEVIATSDGDEAWTALRASDAPRLAILDWMMPGKDGTELCRRAREMNRTNPLYIILLTALERKEDIVTGLEAGADDYITKPFGNEELRARIQVAQRVIELQSALSDRVEELEDALAHVKTLQGIIPICMHCHKIRTDQESWERMENYIQEHSGAEFSHALCPECLDKHYPESGSGEVDDGLSSLSDFLDTDGK